MELGYLRETLLPFLGLSAEALDFLEKNVRYLHLPEELQDLIFRAEQLLRKQEMTESLLRSLAAEFVSQLVRPEIRSVFANGEAMLTGKIKVGKKEIRMKKEDFQKIIQVHDRIRDLSLIHIWFCFFIMNLPMRRQISSEPTSTEKVFWAENSSTRRPSAF